MLTGYEEMQALILAEKALAEALASRESVAQRESYHKEGKLVLLTKAEIELILDYIACIEHSNLVVAMQLQDKLQNL